MDELDDARIKNEIDSIMKKVDEVVKRLEEAGLQGGASEPDKKDSGTGNDGDGSAGGCGGKEETPWH